eukprot:TRINITY_DN37809_c0_g1_i1.p1 TRINITY_DN37809_c0_g1~~TRINITY_DN37809_c0_g1_i1.p1  ORF type:complete len:1241 (-),score=162.93 TRINITY_DN37809_c0_g1_i1:453-4175(-)
MRRWGLRSFSSSSVAAELEHVRAAAALKPRHAGERHVKQQRWKLVAAGGAALAVCLLVRLHGSVPAEGRLLSSEASTLEAHSQCGGGAQASEAKLESTLAFLLFCFLSCSVLDHINLLVPANWRFPISVVMFISGKVVGALFLNLFQPQLHKPADWYNSWPGNGLDNFIEGVHNAARFDPHALLYVILPPLLYESASSMKWHTLKKVLPSSVLLAVPGVMINCLLTGLFVKVAVRVHGEAPSFQASCLLASILSATDPVAVVAALQSLGAPAKLSTLVEGESLLNDGSAVVLVYVFRDWVMGAQAPELVECAGSPPDVGCVTGFFLKVSLGGCAVGAVAGAILHTWIVYIRRLDSNVLELSLVLTAVYATFFLAEAMHCSGVLAVVTFGMIMSANVIRRMSHQGRHSHHTVLSQIGYACNQVTFFVAGIVTARFLWTDTGCDHDYLKPRAWMELLSLYICVHITRLGAVVLFLPILRNSGYGLNWKEGAILVYGGLRGAVGLIMGLIIEHNEHIDPGVKQMIAFHTSGIVLLTLCINGSTVDELYNRLNLYPPNPFRITHCAKMLYKMEGECQTDGVKLISRDWFFKDCHFRRLMRCVPNFRHIQPDASGVLLPVGIKDVDHVLRGLAYQGDDRTSMVSKRTSTLGEFFEVSWAKRKEESRQRFVDFVKSSESKEVDIIDGLLNVSCTGPNKLSYTAREHTGVGLYASSRSMATLQKLEATEHVGVKVTISMTEGVYLSIGLTCENHVEDRARRTLGMKKNTLGINCSTGVVRFFLPECGVRTYQLPVQEVCKGDTLSMRCVMRVAGSWDLSVIVKNAKGEVTDPVLVPLDVLTPDVLYPAVEFYTPENGDGLARAASASNLAGPGWSDTSKLGALIHKVGDLASQAGSSVKTAGWKSKMLPGVDSKKGCCDARSDGSMSPPPLEDVHNGDAEFLGVVPPSAGGVSAFGRPPALLEQQAPEAELEDDVPVQESLDLVLGDSPQPQHENDSCEEDERFMEPARQVSAQSGLPGGVPSPRATARGLGVWDEAPREPASPVSDLQSDGTDTRPEAVTALDGPKKELSMGTLTTRASIIPKAKINLSFEVHTATNSDSVNELFQVMFNSVMHRYYELHDHGVLCDQALSWLTEAVQEAMDCANAEVNSLRVQDFARQQSMSSQRAGFKRRAVTGMFKQRFEAASAFFRKNDEVSGRDDMLINLFEPLVVEYCHLDQVVGQANALPGLSPHADESGGALGVHRGP